MDDLDRLIESDNIAQLGPDLKDPVEPHDYSTEQLAAGEKLTLALDSFEIHLGQRLLIEKLQARIRRLQEPRR